MNIKQKLAGATLLVFCNKQDINGALKVSEIKNVENQIKQLLELDSITTRHWMIMPCSAINNEGLATGLEWIMDDINSRIFMLD